MLTDTVYFSMLSGYHAPLELYIDMNHIALDPAQHTLPPDKDVNVCVGKEWYRFPSSFFLPSERWASLSVCMSVFVFVFVYLYRYLFQS